MSEQILYIPGLGVGRLTKLQERYVRHWENSNRTVTFFDSRWQSDERYPSKYTRLMHTAKQLLLEGELNVIGISAGGALTTRLLHDIPAISKASIVCGKVQGADTIGLDYQKKAPALVDAVAASEAALAEAEIFANKTTVYRPIIDDVVPLQDMLVPGAKTRRLPALGHVGGIATSLVFYLP